jgi:hypothetical protein
MKVNYIQNSRNKITKKCFYVKKLKIFIKKCEITKSYQKKEMSKIFLKLSCWKL